MKKPTVGLVVLGACLALSVVVRASDMVGVYGVVDKVTLEPTVSVILQNGMRLGGRIAKYNAPGGGDAMSGRDLA